MRSASIRFACFTLLFSLMTNMVYAQGAEDPNLLGWWKMDESSGTIAYDSSVNANHGNFRGEPVWSSGFAGGAILLDGVDDYILVDHNDNMLPDTEVTVMAWIITPRHTGAGGSNWQAIISKGSPRVYSLYTEATNMALHFSITTGGNHVGSVSSAQLPLNEWVHVCAMVEDSNQVYFINGIRSEPANGEGQGLEISQDNTAPLRIGNAPENNSFQGKIDDVRVYNGAKTAEEIQAIMLSGLSPLATRPNPDNRAIEVPRDTTLGWKEGQFSENGTRNVYFGSDFNDVNEASLTDPRGVLVTEGLDVIEFNPLAPGELLDYNQVYYWRVDEINETPDTTVHKGDIWYFTVRNFINVDDFEQYTDDLPNRVFDTWLDGWQDATNGSVVGYPNPDFGAGEHFIERGILRGGAQSMPFFYDNHLSIYSEASLSFSGVESDWTRDELDAFSFWYRGFPAPLGGFVEDPPGIYTQTGAGTDIFATADEFNFTFKEITGSCTMIARIDSLENTDPFARAGVMIRDTLKAGSRNTGLFITPENGIRFQYRPIAREATDRQFDPNIVAPYWVRLERTGGGLVRAYYSPDGADWTQFTLTSVAMTNPIYVGLAVGSHVYNVPCTAQFSNVSMTGNGFDGPWINQDVGIRSNSAQPMYVVLNNSTVVYHDDPNATRVEDWTEVKISLQDFADQGADLTNITSAGIGVGNRENPDNGGDGTLYIDDVRLYRP